MIAIVEDDESIAALERYALESCGFEAEIFPDGKSFFRATERRLPKLVILDVMLPDLDGYTIVRRLRETPSTRTLPVMMVTAKGNEVDVVRGLDGGADDYLSKPFGVMEFLSRAKALLRRAELEQQTNLTFREISIQEERHQASVEGEPLDLTLKEYKLLCLFLSRPETAITRDEMMDQVWHSEYTVESRTVDMHIRALRQKLGKAGRYIQTLRKVGYILTAQGSAAESETPA